MLLKGPSVARWLYGEGDMRAYRDTDLLIDPDARTCPGGARRAGDRGLLPDAEMPGWERPARGGCVPPTAPLSTSTPREGRAAAAAGSGTRSDTVGGARCDVSARHGALHAASTAGRPARGSAAR